MPPHGDRHPPPTAIPPSALRSLAGPDTVDRGWARLDRSIRLPRPRRRPGLAYAGLAVALAFGGGTSLGKYLWDHASPPVTENAPEPPAPTGDEGTFAVFAAGTEMRTYDLQDGRITLGAGSTVEVERGGSGTRAIDLLQGEALVVLADAATGSPVLVAGEARVSIQPGSTVRVERRDAALDVSVQQGGADVEAPGLTRHLGPGQRNRDVPLHSADPPAHAPEPTAAKLPSWYEAYGAGDLDRAFRLLRTAGADRAITNAASARELMVIADVMRRQGRDPATAVRAWERVLERFPGAPQAVLAAEHRAGDHPGLALDLALRSGNDALVCHALQHEPDRARAARIAEDYFRDHPNSDCRRLGSP